MIDLAQVATGLFGLCTRLFPRGFRREYGEELQGVFCYRARESLRKGGVTGLLTLCGKELHDLPGNLLHEHMENLCRKYGHGPLAGIAGAWRSAREGAAGFGAGMALWILTRWLLDPMNNGMLTNYWLGLFHETIMFSIMGVIGWFMIGHALFPASKVRQFTWWGAIFGAFGGLMATSFVSNSMRLLMAHPSWHFLGNLIQTTGSLIYGACYGLPIVWESSDWKRASFMVLLSAAFFGIGFWVSEAAFILYFHLKIPIDWQIRYWGIPQAMATALEGLVAGGMLGWMVGWVKPRLPDPEPTKEESHPAMLGSEKNQLVNRSMG